MSDETFLTLIIFCSTSLRLSVLTLASQGPCPDGSSEDRQSLRSDPFCYSERTLKTHGRTPEGKGKESV